MVLLLDTVTAAVNAQIGREQTAHLSYMALATWCDLAGFEGAAAFYRHSAAEEIEHRDKFIDYLASLDARPFIPAVPQVDINPGSLQHTAELALALERSVTVAISQLYALAIDARDYMTAQFLLWFIDEQRTSLAQWLTVSRWFVAFQEDMAMIDGKYAELLEG